MTRSEHLEWAKQRALEYVNWGDLQQAMQSMISDLNKHDELRSHCGLDIGAHMLFSGSLVETEVRSWIVGFN